MPDVPEWRARLREAIERSGKTHGAIAAEAGIDPTTLSRILNGHMQPRFGTVVRIAHACGETVGWLLGEYGYSLSAEERERLRDAAVTIVNATSAGHLLRKDAPARKARRSHPKAFPRHRHRWDP